MNSEEINASTEAELEARLVELQAAEDASDMFDPMISLETAHINMVLTMRMQIGTDEE